MLIPMLVFPPPSLFFVSHGKIATISRDHIRPPSLPSPTTNSQIQHHSTFRAERRPVLSPGRPHRDRCRAAQCRDPHSPRLSSAQLLARLEATSTGTQLDSEPLPHGAIAPYEAHFKSAAQSQSKLKVSPDTKASSWRSQRTKLPGVCARVCL
ncbi:uncharacterized protein B0I36DRAFT_321091 [Microdochium trichocladiopsis]|uniref:Uncharacterized protein n=1 Tax=Microdochium trichocladiopsis TaxID=1682393 RepID=A0A9P9BRT3_9PEZI|nr:uncharacterized protein B0I36DRAFT_321091 [Microdochium trichocladiopsis]KAH7033266.1 hypothetical protein B0I36DRAFT_321091 [Microdochium trichocladiopsis]